MPLAGSILKGMETLQPRIQARERVRGGGDDREGKKTTCCKMDLLMEEGSDLTGLNPSMDHYKLLLMCVYNLHHKNGTHLDGGISDEKVWQHH